MKASLQDAFRPRIIFKNIHLRYEQFAPDTEVGASTPYVASSEAIGGATISRADSFAIGFVLSELSLSRDDGGDGDPTTSRINCALDSAGVYCITAEEGGKPVAAVGDAQGYKSTSKQFFAEQEPSQSRDPDARRDP